MKALLISGLAALALAGCTSATERPGPTGAPARGGSSTTAPGTPLPSTAGTQVPRLAGTVAEHLAVPWGIAFLPDGTALVSERDSRRILAVGGGGPVREVGRIASADPGGEGGVLGLAVSPDFARDQLVFVYVSTAEDNRILAASYAGGRLGSPKVILDGIPRGPIHDGGRLAFGPDGYLYVSTGETGDRRLSQDPDSLAGKILRITEDGRPAPGNPRPGSPVWTLGHRNVQGLAFDQRDRLWASELGASTWDELNLIEKGANYGWPDVEGRSDDPRFRNPLLQWPTSQASPSGLAYLDGCLWMAGLRGQRLWRIPVHADGTVGRPEAFFTGQFGRLRTVVAAPDGTLWVSTSNRDGRGTPAASDDRILRISPGT